MPSVFSCFKPKPKLTLCHHCEKHIPNAKYTNHVTICSVVQKEHVYISFADKYIDGHVVITCEKA